MGSWPRQLEQMAEGLLLGVGSPAAAPGSPFSLYPFSLAPVSDILAPSPPAPPGHHPPQVDFYPLGEDSLVAALGVEL